MLIVEDVLDKKSGSAFAGMKVFFARGADSVSCKFLVPIIHLRFSFVNATSFSNARMVFLFSFQKMQETLYKFSFLCKSPFFYRLPSHFVV